MAQAETVVAWHRKGFRLFWTWKVRHGQPGRSIIARGTRDLIRKMCQENPGWAHFAFTASPGISPKTRAGALALLGALTISFERGVELLNFGALIAFMGVSASSLVRYYIRGGKRGFSDLLPPVFGFVICSLLWWNLNPSAKIAGTIWMVLGLAYGAVRTRGFRGELINFEIPLEP
ncbi:MAG: hypothetical protein WCC04_19510 [Terriglobales bacterium]